MAMNHRLLRPRASGGGFDPRSISGLEMYLNAKVASSITLNGSNVSEWRDLSGNGRHTSQATAANQPAYGTSTWLGRPSVNFTRTSSHFLQFTPFALTTQTAFFVIEPTASIGAGTFPTIFQNQINIADCLNRWIFTDGAGYQTYCAALGASVTDASVGTVGAGLFAQERILISHTYNNAGSTTTVNHGIRKNRAASAVQGSGLLAGARTSFSGRIGCRNVEGSNDEHISARYAMILLYDRVLSAAEIGAVEDWAVSEYPLS